MNPTIDDRRRYPFAGIIFLSVIVFLLSGCVEQIKPEVVKVEISNGQLESIRFQITVVAEFPDDLAYGGKRRIYEIHDGKNGRTYLSITGMGLDQIKKEESESAIEDALDMLNSTE